MKNKNIVIGYRVEIRPQGERLYTEPVGFYETREQAKAAANRCPLLDGDQIRIKTIFTL